MYCRTPLTRLFSPAARLPSLAVRARTPARFRLLAVSAAAATLCIAGCTQASRLNLATTTGGDAALFGQFRAYDGHSGQPLTFAQVVRRCATADVVLFGEEHSDAVCNQFEAQLLSALAARPRPVALAMEFFETDTQAALNDYLEGQIDEPAFREATRQGRAYALAHRPLIEICQAACIPVIAANAPRRLVHDYRKSKLDYTDFRAGLAAADQRWLPPQNEYLTGAYHERFIETMMRHGRPPRPATTLPSAPATAPSPASVPPSPPAIPPGQPVPAGPPSRRAPDSAPNEDPAQLLAGLAATSNRLAQAASEISRTLTKFATATQPASSSAGSARAPGSTAAPPGMTAVAAAPASRPAVSQPASMMAEKMDPEAFYHAQLLWDEAMADSIADFRARRPHSRVMLIVGRFHVAKGGGTAQKLGCRRPGDRILTVVYSGSAEDLAFNPADCDAGDIIIHGIEPPPKNGEPAMAPRTAASAKMPDFGGNVSAIAPVNERDLPPARLARPGMSRQPKGSPEP